MLVFFLFLTFLRVVLWVLVVNLFLNLLFIFLSFFEGKGVVWVIFLGVI
jgi:hypothetical protein